LYEEGDFFNFGVFHVNPAKNQADVEIHDENGKIHFSQTFQLEDKPNQTGNYGRVIAKKRSLVNFKLGSHSIFFT
jgi:hypothetical protein